MKKEETYNGWTNYATWRINLELFDPYQFDPDAYETEQDEKATAQYLADLCEEIVIEGTNDLCASYARAFLDQVNFYEIAQHINEQLKNH